MGGAATLQRRPLARVLRTSEPAAAAATACCLQRLGELPPRTAGDVRLADDGEIERHGAEITCDDFGEAVCCVITAVLPEAAPLLKDEISTMTLHRDDQGKKDAQALARAGREAQELTAARDKAVEEGHHQLDIEVVRAHGLVAVTLATHCCQERPPGS